MLLKVLLYLPLPTALLVYGASAAIVRVGFIYYACCSLLVLSGVLVGRAQVTWELLSFVTLALGINEAVHFIFAFIASYTDDSDNDSDNDNEEEGDALVGQYAPLTVTSILVGILLFVLPVPFSRVIVQLAWPVLLQLLGMLTYVIAGPIFGYLSIYYLFLHRVLSPDSHRHPLPILEILVQLFATICILWLLVFANSFALFPFLVDLQPWHVGLCVCIAVGCAIACGYDITLLLLQCAIWLSFIAVDDDTGPFAVAFWLRQWWIVTGLAGMSVAYHSYASITNVLLAYCSALLVQVEAAPFLFPEYLCLAQGAVAYGVFPLLWPLIGWLEQDNHYQSDNVKMM